MHLREASSPFEEKEEFPPDFGRTDQTDDREKKWNVSGQVEEVGVDQSDESQGIRFAHILDDGDQRLRKNDR